MELLKCNQPGLANCESDCLSTLPRTAFAFINVDNREVDLLSIFSMRSFFTYAPRSVTDTILLQFILQVPELILRELHVI